jgi:hypothetical protein
MRMTAIILSTALMISGSLFAGESKTYEVTITNLTKGQIFTPVLAATHKSDIAFFELGAPAIEGSNSFNRLSFAAMLLPTNDSFVAADSVMLPRNYRSVTACAYDAGTEYNDELCVSIPGPPVAFCQGANVPDDSGEGYVHVSNGVHGIGDTIPMLHDWRGPVAKVAIRRVK